MNRELQAIALVVHGGLAAGHALGILYNVRRRNWWDVAAHTAALSYDIYATHKHAKALGGEHVPGSGGDVRGVYSHED